MSLNNIHLPPIVIEDLFKKSLVGLKNNQQKSTPQPVAAYSMLGKNKKGIVILIAKEETAFLPEEELNFLIGILSACQLTLEDVGILNMAKNISVNYHQFEQEIFAKKILLFGVALAALELPLSFPYYQVQAYNNHSYLSAPALNMLMQDKAEKLKLWNSLRLVFEI